MSSPVPSWIERLLGISAGSGEGTAWGLEHSWRWPAWITLLIVILAVVVVVATYLHEGRRMKGWFRALLASIRLALVAIALLMLAQLVLSLKRTGLPYVAILLDDSLSMTVADRYPEPTRTHLESRVRGAGFDQLTRWNLARTLLVEDDAALMAGIAQDYRLRFYYLSGPRAAASAGEPLAAEVRSAQAAGDSTRLGSAIQAVLDELRGNAPAAVVLLTDGINTEGPGLVEAAAQARRRSVPLYLVGLGLDQPVRDVKLSDLLVDDVVFLGDVVFFEARLSASGYQGRSVQVVLRREDRQEVLAKADITLGPDGQSQPVRLAYRPGEAGEFRYVVEAGPLQGELQTRNNRQQKTVRVRKEKIRVLLVEGEPRFEYRYLRNLLAREPTIELKTVLEHADPEHAEQDSAALRNFPVRREELSRYDVVILGDVDPGSLSATIWQNLADFVGQPGKGGALVCIAGPRFMPAAYRDTPLAGLLPVNPATVRAPAADRLLAEGFVVRPTDLGLDSPALQLADAPAENAAVWGRLAPLYWMLEAAEWKPGARVLAVNPARLGPDGQPLPVIVMHYVGAGKVLFHATDETWRWRFRVGDLCFARYWVQTIRALARSKLADAEAAASLTTDRREYRHGEPVRLRLRFHDDRLAPAEDDGASVVLEYPDGKSQRLTLRRGMGGRGVFEGTLEGPPVGSYHAWVASPQRTGPAPAADFTVLPPPGEFARIEADIPQMQRAAEMTRGRFYSFATADRLRYELPEGRQVPIESLPPRPLWNAWPVLAAFLVLLIGEWALRKLGGLA